MTRFAGEHLMKELQGGSRFGPKAGDRAASNHGRYAFNGFHAENRRVPTPEMEDTDSALKLREKIKSKREATNEEERIKAQYGG